jgi:hypothetical protein
MVEMITIEYNASTYNIENSDTSLSVEKTDNTYKVHPLKEKKPIITIQYKEITIITDGIHTGYVVLQHIYNTKTLLELSKLHWDYNEWQVKIVSDKKLPDWANILNCLLNLGDQFNKHLNINDLDKVVSLNDKRGWGGERPREVYYKLGFPLYTSKTKKSLSNSQRLFECPFPICTINPERKAVVSLDIHEKKCFTCGLKEGESNIFGNTCHFEKGHFEPHIVGGAVTSGNQCKWCNSFYKDKICWNEKTGKPTFNSYAILRDAPKREIIQHLKDLGFTPKDFE